MRFFNSIGTRVKALGISVALCGSLFCCSPVTAFAGGPDCSCETKCTEDHIDPDCPICQADYRNCQGKDPEVEEKWGPLTPDGNMELVDDYGSIEAGGKQFITVMTKNGNYFYIIIDRDDDGNEKVHFLNMVDESDLLSLMDEDQVSEYIKVTGIGAKEEKVEEPAPVVTPEPEPVEEPEPEPEVEEKKPVNVNGIMALILIVALGGAAGFMYYTSTKNSKKKSTLPDPDEDYEDEDYLSSFDDDDVVSLDDEDEGIREELPVTDKEDKEEV
ncbi:protein of unknown function [Butyrivibrio sp. ob235]|uniref:DUF4366 domain-containing protein n=1 Tax=Butyrivibrio sp. ob235 TaxID=1761780 RepID=UPI0008CCF32F|nr:DUF4366 domain-containing protein [Butyrivibrio sp. ob235]SEM20220.1 protein of unknown function [Butyrivibrio sp. ob235]